MRLAPCACFNPPLNPAYIHKTEIQLAYTTLVATISDIPLAVVMCVIVLLTTRLADKGSRLTFLRDDVQQRKKILMLRDTGDERRASRKIAKARREMKKW